MTSPTPRPPRWTEYLPLSTVLQAPRNPKTHASQQLRESMQRFGVVELPAIDDRTGCLVAGHGRLADWQNAKLNGKPPPDGVVMAADGSDWLVPVNRGWASADDTEAEAYLIVSNNSTIMGGWDEDGLDAMLADIARADFPLAQVTGVSAAELEALLTATAQETDLPPLPSMAELLRAQGQTPTLTTRNAAHLEDPLAAAPWMAQTAPQYDRPDGSALGEAHRAAYPDLPAPDPLAAERAAMHRRVASGTLHEMTIVYPADEHAEVNRLISDARRILGQGMDGGEIILHALRALLADLASKTANP